MGKRKYDGKEEATKKSDTEVNAVKDVVSKEPQDEETESPKQKVPRKSGFDVKHFRKELAAKHSQTTVLTQFLQVCLDPDSTADVMLEYIKAGGNSHEILRQVSAENRKNLTLATPAFHIFHLIILKVQSSQPHMITITEEACRYFLNNFMTTVEIMISENSGPRHRKIILKLLTSMVTLNPDLGIEVLNQAPLTPKHLQHILEKPNYKEKDNVRTAFVHFMTSFLVDGHLPVIKALLEKQGLLNLVIPGLTQDEAEAVLMFLNILKKNVIENPLISKSLKLKTFSQNVLHQLFKVFFWKGPPETSHEVIIEYRPEVTGLLRNILLTLFTNNKLGLYFTDNLLGTTDANKNQSLYKALLSLKRPWENQYQSEIVLEIVFRCPDLHRAVISLIEQSFEPQHTVVWEKTVDFTIKLYDKLRPENMVQRFTHMNSLQVANFVRFATLPIPLLKNLQKGLSKPDRTLALYCIKVLGRMLVSVKRYMQILDMSHSSGHITELKNKLEYFFPKHLPVPGVIVALIQDIVKGEKTAKTKQDYTLPSIDDADGLISLIDLLLLYNDIHPAHFETLEGTLSMKDILDFSAKVSEEHTSLLKFKIVSLWLSLDSSAVSLRNPMFKELFHIMLEVYTGDGLTWIDAKETLFKFLKSTGIFEADEDEIHTMLYSLRNSNVNTSSVSDTVAYVLENIQDLSDYMRTLKSDFEVNDTHSEVNLDKLFDKLSEGKDVDNNSLLETKTASPFVAGCVKLMKSNKEVKKSLKQFLSVYVANLLHSSYSPEMTERLIGDTKLDAKNYAATWVSEPVALDEGTAGKDSILTNISKYIIDDDDLTIPDIFPFMEIATADDHDVAILEAYYKLNATELDSSELFLWAKYLIFCTIRLANIDQLSKNRQKKINTVFELLIQIGMKSHMIDVCRAVLVSMLKNPHFLKIFSPMDQNNNSYVLATEFLLNVVTKYTVTIEFLNKNYKILKAYQKKNHIEITKTLEKIKKKRNINTGNVVKVLETVGMEPADDIRTLNQIFTMEPAHCVKDDKEPSIVLEVIRVILEKYSRAVNLTLQKSQLNQIFTLYTKLLTDKEIIANLTNIENVLIEYFENKPFQVKCIPESDFKQFFYANTIRKTTAQLSAILLRFNQNLCSVFKEELSRQDILSQRELTLPLGNALLHHNKFLLENKELLNKIFNEYKSNIFKVLEKPHKAGQIYINCWKFIRKLLIECIDVEDCEKLFNKSHKFETVATSHVQLLSAVFLKLCLYPDKCKRDHLTNYFLSMLSTMTIALKDSKEPNVLNEIVTQIYIVADVSTSIPQFEAHQKGTFQKVIESGIWQNFCKAVLKDSLRLKNEEDQSNSPGPKQLFLLTTLTKMFYPEDHDDVTSVFDMATSHSEFLKIMLSHNSADLKSRLIEFLFTLIKLNKNIMKQQQIPVYLSSYGATRHPCDRLILAILHYYEANGLPVQEYKPYLWSDSAANYYAVRKTRTSTLWSQPTPNQIINLFEKETLIRTLENFPVNQKLEYDFELPPIDSNTRGIKALLQSLTQDGIFEQKTKDDETQIRDLTLKAKYEDLINGIAETELTVASHRESPLYIYDPGFVIPLLSHMLAPGSAASCFKLLRKGLLSLPVAALGSKCPRMRAAAYHVLHRFHLLLETETKHKNDKILLSDFIETLRHSLTSAITIDEAQEFNIRNPRLPAVHALYLAKAVMICTAPFEPTYKPINNFLIAKEQVDLTVVPDFLNLFHDCDVESAERRNWILDIIRSGMKTMADVHVIFKTMCLKMMMDFYGSVLCDRKGREKILSVIQAIVSIPRAAEILIEGYGLVSWTQGVVRQMGKDDRVLYRSLLGVFRSLIQSMTVTTYTKVTTLSKKNGKSIVDYPELRVNKDLEHDIVTILYDMLSLADFVEVEDLVGYLSTFNSLSRKAVKLLNKKELLNLVNKGAVFSKDTESLTLLNKAVSANSDDVLSSKVFSKLDSNNVEDSLIFELKTIVSNYVL